MIAEHHGSDIATDSPSRIERRRPGPRVQVNAMLIPLMRGQNAWDYSRDRFTRHRPHHDIGSDPLSTVRGIAFAVLVCGIFWVGVASLF